MFNESVSSSLTSSGSGIELLNVKKDDHLTYATVFVPDDKLVHFEKLIKEYIEEKKDRNGKPRDNRELIDAIQEIRAAVFDDLWTDTPEALPSSDDEIIWWEVWLPVRDDRIAVATQFRNIAQKIGFQLAEGDLNFPERTVLLMRGSKRQIQQSILLLNSIAELRRAKDTAEFFDSLTQIGQREWVDDLLRRTELPNEDSPYVCILDTGVNNGHPLLEHSLKSEDLHVVDVSDTPADDNGHGTGMAGIVLYGDLTHAFVSGDTVKLSYSLESVKILREDGDNAGKHYGYITAEAVSRPEIKAPERSRVFSMAVTAKDGRDRGRPSAWSATIDRLASDWEGDGLSPRLLVISAGNIQNNKDWLEYPHSNSTDGIHDPGQSWNALTVGAFTEKDQISEDDASGYTAIAPAGCLSPFSTTSCTWEKAWPLKPDVVMEGGNAAKDSIGAVWMHSLSLLTTCHMPDTRLLTTTNATSAATSLCSGMAARLMAAYPDLWPETIRALIVHSARWTEPMLAMFKTGSTQKEQFKNLIRHCGFGVPDLDSAFWSAGNSLTLIVQDELQPFEKHDTGSLTARDMHLHKLPWPAAQLEELGATEIEMRVTLSYFIEPNPAERGIKGRYKYESHGLRFDVKRSLEGLGDFRARINRLVRDEEEGTPTRSSDEGWDLGPQLRHLGSIHSDVWRGQAIKLAERGFIAVFPALGWWKTRTRLMRYNKKARYALLISIHAPEIEVDLYNAVQALVKIPIEIST